MVVLVTLVVLALAVAGGIAVLMTRYGLLSTAAMQLTANLMHGFPITLDFDAWYAPYGAIAFVGIGALTLFGLRCARPAPA
jgi:hypothetical protein